MEDRPPVIMWRHGVRNDLVKRLIQKAQNPLVVERLKEAPRCMAYMGPLEKIHHVLILSPPNNSYSLRFLGQAKIWVQLSLGFHCRNALALAWLPFELLRDADEGDIW